MSLLIHFLIATLSIAGLMLLRTLLDRYALRTKLRGNRAAGDCEQIGCLKDCDSGTAKRNTPERSEHHAH